MIANTLRALDACPEAIQWSKKRRDPRRAWNACERGDWLLWIAARLGVDRTLVVLAACDCARTALRYVPAGEDNPSIAIETTEKWCREAATLEEVRSARDGAYAAAARACSSSVPAYAVYTARAACYAARAAATAAESASDCHAAARAVYAARVAEAVHAYSDSDRYAIAAGYDRYAIAASYAADAEAIACDAGHKRLAAIVRKRIPWSMVKPKWEERMR